MAQIKTKFIEDGAVNEDKVLLSNNGFLKGRNVADSADVDIIKVNASDALELAAKLNDPSSAAPTIDTQLSNKKYVDDQVASISIPSVFELQGNWDADTNSPTLANTDTGVADYLYYVNVAGSTDFGAGSKTFSVGDWVYNVNGAWEKADNNDDVLSVNGQVGTVVLDTDDISEGTNKYYAESLFNASLATKDTDDLSESATNLYYTSARAALKTNVADLASNANALGASLVGIEDSGGDFTATEVEGALAELKADIAAATGANKGEEAITLDGTDITNQSVTLANAPISDVAMLFAGGVNQIPGVDYSVSGTTLSFLGDLATAGAAALVAGDILVVYYEYA